VVVVPESSELVSSTSADKAFKFREINLRPNENKAAGPNSDLDWSNGFNSAKAHNMGLMGAEVDDDYEELALLGDAELDFDDAGIEERLQMNDALITGFPAAPMA